MPARPRRAALIVALTSLGCLPGPERPLEADPSQRADPAPAARVERVPEPAPLVPIVAAPEPPPEPPAFAGRETVTVAELLAAVEAEVPQVAASPAVAADYAQLLARFELADDPALYLDYVRIKIAFEATRAGGWWGLRWAITNEEPNSSLVWAAWHAREGGAAVPDDLASLPSVPITTATAECDELSALFAFVAQRIGLSARSEVGLLWPTGNHVVAVWTLDRKSDAPTRIVVPTSQIFLDPDQSLGTDGFDPWKQKKIFDYRRQDAPLDLTIPATLASGFVRAIREHGGRSQADLQRARNMREVGQYGE